MRLCGELDLRTFSSLHSIEAYLRFVVRWELSCRYGKNWRSNIPQEIQRSYEARQKEEREVGVVRQYDGDLAYLTLSELRDLFLGQVHAKLNNWPACDIIKSDIKKLLQVRNKLAHFRPLVRQDCTIVDRFSEDLSHWTSEYRRVRERAKYSSRNPEALSQLESGGGSLRAILEAARGRRPHPISIGSVQGVYFVAGRIEGDGSIESDGLLELMSTNPHWLVRVTPSLSGVEVYLPRDAAAVEVEHAASALLELIGAPTRKLSLDEVEELLAVHLRDSIILSEVSFPFSFAEFLQSGRLAKVEDVTRTD